MSNNQEFKKLSELLNEYLKKEKIDQKVLKARVISEWHNIVGPHIFKNTYNLRFDNDTFIMSVRSDVLRQELLFMKNKLIQNIHEYVKTEFIKDIIFY